MKNARLKIVRVKGIRGQQARSRREPMSGHLMAVYYAAIREPMRLLHGHRFRQGLR